jgi:hypothetical protein
MQVQAEKAGKAGLAAATDQLPLINLVGPESDDSIICPNKTAAELAPTPATGANCFAASSLLPVACHL